MQKIKEQISLTIDQANSTYEDLIIAILKYTDDLYEIIGRDSVGDKEYVDRVIEIFSVIMNRQRRQILELENKYENMFLISDKSNDCASASAPYMKEFASDEDVYKAFEYYLMNEVNKPLSSYTINDYCSRIKILYSVLQDNSMNGQALETPLLDAYHNLREVQLQLNRRIETDKENRNLANARAALNKFGEFKDFVLTRGVAL